MISEVQAALIVLGVVAVIYPLSWAIWFWRDRDGIGRRLSYMLLGETVSMSTAVYFALNSYLNLYNSMDPWVSAGLRTLIFGTALFSTVLLVRHLRRRIKRLSKR